MTSADSHVLLIHEYGSRASRYREILTTEPKLDVSVAMTFEEVRNRPVPDLILLDLELAQTPSLEMLEWLRSDPSYKHVPVIAMTAPDTVDRIPRAYELGANSCVMKSENGDLMEEVARGIRSYAQVLKANCPVA